MKTRTLTSLFLLLSTLMFAQAVQVPSNLTQKLKSAFPTATDISWDEEDGNYEANFEVDGTEISVVMNSDAEILETETEMEISDLPANIAEYVSENYEGFVISEAAKIELKNGEMLYEAEITKGDIHKDLLFDSKGKIEKKDEDEEDED